MGTCDSGPGQRGQRSADCYAQCREVTMLAPVAMTTRWCGRCPGLFHQIPAPSLTPTIGSVIAMSGRMWKAPCRRKGEEYVQAGSPPRTLPCQSAGARQPMSWEFTAELFPASVTTGRCAGRLLPACVGSDLAVHRSPSVHHRGAAHSA